jgi:hypothetical protein
MRGCETPNNRWSGLRWVSGLGAAALWNSVHPRRSSLTERPLNLIVRRH